MLFFFSIAGLFSCTDDVQDDVDNLTDRVAALEGKVDTLNLYIKAGKLITSVTPTTEGAGGYLITFSDKKTITISNGKDGNPGNPGDNGKTPYVWINANGNWAVNPEGAKPDDADDAKYEIKDNDGNSFLAQGPQGEQGEQGVSVKVVENENGYLDIVTYREDDDTYEGTTLPLDIKAKGNVTGIVEDNQNGYITLTIGGKDYKVGMAVVYPQSITLKQTFAKINKLGKASFRIAVNPSTCKAYTKDDFELQYEANYRTIDYKKVALIDNVTYNENGQYTITVACSEDLDDITYFIVLNFKDLNGDNAQVVSSTPITITANVDLLKDEDIIMSNDTVKLFVGETYSGEITFNNIAQQYLPNVEASEGAFVTTTINSANGLSIPFTIRADSKGEENIEMTFISGDQSLKKNIHVVVYPNSDMLAQAKDIHFWIPTETTNYVIGFDKLIDSISNKNLSDWNFELVSTTLAKDGIGIDLTNNIIGASTFSKDNNYALQYKLLPTINPGKYLATAEIKATNASRPKGLPTEKTLKVTIPFAVYAPVYEITLKANKHNPFEQLNPSIDIKLDTLFENGLSSASNHSNLYKQEFGITSNSPSYELNDINVINPQGVKVSCDGNMLDANLLINHPSSEEWNKANNDITRQVKLWVELKSGQIIPIYIYDGATAINKEGKLDITYVRQPMTGFTVAQNVFNISYEHQTDFSYTIDIFKTDNGNENFTDFITATGKAYGVEFVKIVAKEPIQAMSGSVIPEGLVGKYLYIVNGKSITRNREITSWDNTNVKLYQVFTVTYMDIFGAEVSKDITINFMNNQIPNGPIDL